MKYGKFYGNWKIWHENGRLRTDITYKNGIQEGVAINWYKTGSMMSKKAMKDGNKKDCD